VHTHYWDPLFAATSECGLALAIHFGSSSRVPTTSADAPSVVSAALAPTSLAFAFTDWIFSGVLDQFRNLKMLMSEGGIGWIPYMIQRCETTIRDQLWTLKTGTDGTGTSLVRSVGLKRPIERSPREIFDAQIYGCFIDDAFGCRHLDEIGVDNVLIETDFPHGDSSYPTSLEKARDHLSAQTDEVRQKVLRGNAARLFDLHFADELMAPVRA
jgi:predicted TIM-barrel fold metal-dependent hydrolase